MKQGQAGHCAGCSGEGPSQGGVRTLPLGAASAVGLEGSGKKDLGRWFVMCSSPALGGEEGEPLVILRYSPKSCSRDEVSV